MWRAPGPVQDLLVVQGPPWLGGSLFRRVLLLPFPGAGRLRTPPWPCLAPAPGSSALHSRDFSLSACRCVAEACRHADAKICTKVKQTGTCMLCPPRAGALPAGGPLPRPAWLPGKPGGPLPICGGRAAPRRPPGPPLLCATLLLLSTTARLLGSPASCCCLIRDDGCTWAGAARQRQGPVAQGGPRLASWGAVRAGSASPAWPAPAALLALRHTRSTRAPRSISEHEKGDISTWNFMVVLLHTCCGLQSPDLPLVHRSTPSWRGVRSDSRRLACNANKPSLVDATGGLRSGRHPPAAVEALGDRAACLRTTVCLPSAL